MFHQGTRRLGGSDHDASAVHASAFSVPVPSLAIAIVGIALLTNPHSVFAQHGGGGGGGGRGMMSTGAGGVVGGRPDGVDDKDSLKDFHRAMALQATAEQCAAFAKVTQYTEAAGDQLKGFRESLPKAPASSSLSDRAATLDEAIEKARASNRNFLTSFSSVQKSGLKDITSKLEKADSEVDKQIKTLDSIAKAPTPETDQIAASAATLDKEFAGFQNEQLALGREMSILFPAPGENVTFSLPAMTNSISVADQAVAFPVSGALLQTSAANGENLFNVKVVADLSDLQQHTTSILSSQLNRSPRCGERITIQEATLTPLAPASLVAIQFHFERWTCPLGSGGISTELVDAEAKIDIKLTPSVDPKASLGLVSEISHVEAEGALRDSLLSGDLGVMMREQTAAALVTALQKGTSFEVTLPAAAHESATLQKAQFEDTGADQLSLILDGRLQFSNEQTKQFVAQLKQRLSAQGTSPQQ